MRKIIQRILIHILVGLIVFAAALLYFNYRHTAEKGSAVAELAGSAYPVMEIANDSQNYNLMSAYRSDIDLSLVRNQVTIIDYSMTVNLRLHYYDYDITAIQYVLFEKSEDDPMEEGTLNRLEDDQEQKIRTGSLTFENDLKQGKSYYLKMTVRLDSSTQVSFYTKIMNGSGYHLEEYLTYAADFHESLFDDENMEDIAVYLESSSDVDNTSLQSVTIHSSSEAVFYGNMEVQEESAPQFRVKELNGTYAVIEVRSILSSEISDGVIRYYDVSEIFKIRYTEERMYLLDYERSMNAYYNESVIDASNNYLMVDIQDEDNIDYVSSDGGYKLCFVQEGQLWYYNYSASDLYKVYSFSTENLSDLRNDPDGHGLKILSMDEDGNICYLVYGYMNRGRHEGENGILIMKYDADSNYNEELAFLVSSVPYSSLKEDLERLSYLNDDNVFYCVLDGDFHQVNLKKKTDEILRSGIVDENLTASKDQRIIAIEKKKNKNKNRKIEMIDLETGQTQTFTCGKAKRICSVGFLSEDFIYGIADADDVSQSSSGVVTFPIKKLFIMKIDGEEVKSYSKSNRYILETSVNGNVLEMTFGKKSGGSFVETSDTDYIRYKEEETSDGVSIVSMDSDIYGKQLYFQFPEYVYIQTVPDLISANILTSEDDVSFALDGSGEQVVKYYVYASGKQQGVYTNLPEAVEEASEARGEVIDSNENTVWQCIFDEYAQVAGMDNVTKVSSNAKSLAACLSMIAAVNGKNVLVSDIDTGSGTAASLLEEYTGQETLYLTGCSLDDVLYYISKGSPVLAKYNSSRYVVVMSYNSTKVRYLDPVTGLSTVVSRTELADTIKSAGNVFYSYLK